MARETKIGVALMVLLVGVFGAVVYKKWDALKPTIAAAKTEGDAKEKGEKPPEKGKAAEKPNAPAEPPANPFDNVAATPASPPAQDEPSDDPFADSSVAGSEVPVRTVSQAEPVAWDETTPEPAAQGEPFAREDSPVSTAVVPAQGEPGGETAEPIPVAATGSSQVAVTEEDPFGEPAVAADDAAQPMPNDDPFGAAESSVASAETAPANASSAVADSEDPFGDAETTTASIPPAATEPVDASDPFADAVTASAPPAATEPVDGDDPFADAVEPAATASTDFAVAMDETAAPRTDSSEQAPATTSEPAIADAEPSEFSQPQSEPGNDDPFGAVATTDEQVAIAEETTSAGATVMGASDDFADAAAPAQDAPAIDAFETDLAAIEPEPESRFDAAEEPAADVNTEENGVEHVVVAENDSYWSISKKVYGTPAYFHALAKFNESRIRDPKRLRAGMTVLTPDAEELAAKYPKLVAGAGGQAPADQDAQPGFLVDAEGRPAYRVGEDDTLGKIAQIHLGRASRWVQIYEMNRRLIPNAKSLKPGTVLRLPGDASRVRLVPEG